jgi:cell division protein FtsW
LTTTGYADAGALGARDAGLEEVSLGERRGRFDMAFLVLVLILLVVGVVTVLSASYASAYYESGDPTYYFTRQLAFAAGGVVIMLGVSRFTTRFMRRWSMWLLVFAIALLVLVLMFGETRNHAKRWFKIGSITFQPSEIAKIAVIMSFSVMMCKYGENLRKFKKGTRKKFFISLIPFVAVLGVVVFLLLKEPHKSAAIIILAIAAIVLFTGGFDTKICLIAIVAAILAAVVLVKTVDAKYLSATEEEKKDYATNRIIYWLHPDDDPADEGYQILQSLYAVGSGGLTGVGLGQSRQKYLYLPEEHNDYIFAIFCEEFGYVGAMFILVMFALLIIRGFWIALHARSRFDALVAAGITGMFAIQVFLNISVVTNFIPCTGISLPFFSYGGTALLVQLAEMGIVLAISRDITPTRAG